MSNLKLNIPITFEAGAALQIKEDITQSVQNSYGMLTTFNQSATGFDMFLSYLDSTDEHYSGLSINQNKIILDATYTYIQAPGGGRTEFFSTTDGKAKIKTDYITADNVTAKSLSTTGGASTININAGIINCSSSSTNTQIEFGIDGSGDAVLKFILNGNVLYNLGPKGLTSLRFTDESPSFSEFTLKGNSTDYNNTNIFNVNSGANYYIPVYDGNYNYWDVDTTGEEPEMYSSFSINSKYLISYSGESLSPEQISNLVIYENLSNLVNKYVIINFNNISSSKYYKYSCGFKKIANIMKYYIENEENLLDNKPIYNGKTYKSNPSSYIENYVTDTSNYISNGKYITGDITIPIDKIFTDTPVDTDSTAGVYFSNYGDIHLDVESEIDYIIVNGVHYAFDPRALDIREFIIHNYNSGDELISISGYFIVVYSRSDLTTAIQSNVPTFYNYNYSYYFAYSHDFSDYGARALKDKYNGSSNCYGILCRADGTIYIPSGTTFDIDDYYTFLGGSSEEDEEPMG